MRDARRRPRGSSIREASGDGSRKAASGAEGILKFYDRRGYRNAVGTGRKPAIVVIDFSNAFTRGASEFPGGDFASETAQTRRLLDVARELDLPIFYTTIAYADPEKNQASGARRCRG